MKKTRHTATQIVGMLREAEALLGTGKSVPEVARHLGIGESTFYRWRGEYTGVQVDAVTRLKELEEENRRLNRWLRSRPWTSACCGRWRGETTEPGAEACRGRARSAGAGNLRAPGVQSAEAGEVDPAVGRSQGRA